MTSCARLPIQVFLMSTRTLTFRVQQQAFGEYGETIRTISLKNYPKT
jgi:hypothetical protein